MTETRHIRQTFHRACGHELRSTWQSTRAYKRHCHPQLSIGAITEGQTCCTIHDREYILTPATSSSSRRMLPTAATRWRGNHAATICCISTLTFRWHCRSFAIKRCLIIILTWLRT